MIQSGADCIIWRCTMRAYVQRMEAYWKDWRGYEFVSIFLFSGRPCLGGLIIRASACVADQSLAWNVSDQADCIFARLRWLVGPLAFVSDWTVCLDKQLRTWWLEVSFLGKVLVTTQSDSNLLKQHQDSRDCSIGHLKRSEKGCFKNTRVGTDGSGRWCVFELASQHTEKWVVHPTCCFNMNIKHSKWETPCYSGNAMMMIKRIIWVSTTTQCFDDFDQTNHLLSPCTDVFLQLIGCGSMYGKPNKDSREGVLDFPRFS